MKIFDKLHKASLLRIISINICLISFAFTASAGSPDADKQIAPLTLQTNTRSVNTEKTFEDIQNNMFKRAFNVISSQNDQLDALMAQNAKQEVDINNFVQDQMKKFQMAQEQAEKFALAKNEEIQTLRAELASSNSHIENLNYSFKQLNDENKALKSLIKKNEQLLNDENHTIEQLYKELETTQNLQQDLMKKISINNKDLFHTKTALSNLHKDFDKTQAKLKNAQKNNQILQNENGQQVEMLAQENERLRLENDNYIKNLEQFKNRYDVLDAGLNDKEKIISKISDNLNNLARDLQTSKTQKKENEIKLDNTQKEKIKLVEELEILKGVLSEDKNNRNQLHTKLQNLEIANQGAEKTIKDRDLENEQLRSEIEKIVQELKYKQHITDNLAKTTQVLAEQDQALKTTQAELDQTQKNNQILQDSKDQLIKNLKKLQEKRRHKRDALNKNNENFDLEDDLGIKDLFDRHEPKNPIITKDQAIQTAPMPVDNNYHKRSSYPNSPNAC